MCGEVCVFAHQNDSGSELSEVHPGPRNGAQRGSSCSDCDSQLREQVGTATVRGGCRGRLGQVRQRQRRSLVAELEAPKVIESEPAKPAARCSMPPGMLAVGTSKAAAAGGVAGTAPSTPKVAFCLDGGWIPHSLVSRLLSFLLPRTLFEPNTLFKIGYRRRYKIPAEISGYICLKLVRHLRALTHLKCTSHWKPS